MKTQAFVETLAEGLGSIRRGSRATLMVENFIVSSIRAGPGATASAWQFRVEREGTETIAKHHIPGSYGVVVAGRHKNSIVVTEDE